MTLRKRLLLLCSLFILHQARLEAKDIQANPDNYKSLFAKLEAGDRLMLGQGQYKKGLLIKNRHGQPKRPIIIQGTKKTVFLARNGANTIDLIDASWITIRNLTFKGQNLAVDAIKAQKRKGTACHHIIIENCTILDHGKTQNTVAINTKAPCWDWIIRGNIIERAGTGLYLGNSDGHEPFIRGIIENNVIRDPRGYCMQIKHQISRPEIKGIPKSQSRTLVRHNVFIKNDKKGDAGDRPNLLLGGVPKTGAGSKDRYEVYGNVFFHNPRESLFQGTGHLTIHDNIFIDCPKKGIAIQSHHGFAPLSIKIYHNTFFQVAKAYSITGMAPKALRITAHNLILIDKTAHVSLNDRLVSGALIKKAVLRASLEFGSMDFQPRGTLTPKKPIRLKKWAADDTDSSLDFLGQKKKTWKHCGAIYKKTAHKAPILDTPKKLIPR